MLLEAAIGDAYGAGFEYAPLALIRAHNTADHYVKHPRHNIGAGRYTDDTQMSLAVAEAIVAGDPWTPATLAERFVAVFKRDPREGYAGGFQAFLEEVRDGPDFLARIRPDSDKSGGAMRAAPCGVFPTPEEVLERARVQAAITHNTPDGIGAAQAAALMSHYFLYRRGPKAGLGTFLKGYVPGEWDVPWAGKVGSQGWMSVRAAVTAVQAATTMRDLLRACVAYSGDVDTVATIALAAASACSEIAQDLPAPLLAVLETGPYGRDYLIARDRQLLARVA
jgi:ADP-ribosylglycohydrolase